MKKLILFFSLITGILFSCTKENEDLDDTSTFALTPYILPSYPRFPAPFLLSSNPLSTQGVRLGRLIFYDYKLSGNGRACASCHQQAHAFMVNNTVMGLDPKLYHNIPSLVNKA